MSKLEDCVPSGSKCGSKYALFFHCVSSCVRCNNFSCVVCKLVRNNVIALILLILDEDDIYILLKFATTETIIDT